MNNAIQTFKITGTDTRKLRNSENTFHEEGATWNKSQFLLFGPQNLRCCRCAYWEKRRYVIKYYIQTLNPNKATGCDQIQAELPKHASLQIAPVISNRINKSLHEYTFPKYILTL